MKLTDIMDQEDYKYLLEHMVKPPKRAPSGKGVDPVAVQGYVVQGHWRRRGIARNHRDLEEVRTRKP